MAKDILLVIGSVSAAEYAPLHKAMIDRGLDPEIVRVEYPENLPILSHDAYDREYDGIPDSERPSHALVIGTRQWEYLARTIPDLEVKRVKAIVHDTYSLVEELLAAMRHRVATYFVTDYDSSGRKALKGSGYGSTLKI